MAKLPDYPGVSSFLDRHGVTRYKFRKTGLKPATIPGQPHTPQFDAAYQAAIEGRVAAKAVVVQHPRAAHPASLDACWAKVQKRPKFMKLDPTTQYQYTYIIEDWLNDPVDENGPRRGTGPVADLRPRHIQDSLDKLSASNSAILKLMIKKLMKEARLQDWIETDPTYGCEVVDRAPGAGRKPWPPHLCAKFEAHWPLGSTPRTVYEIARWLGIRVSDIVRLRWAMLVPHVEDGRQEEGFEFVPFKGRNKEGASLKFHPMTPMLEAALAHLDRAAEFVILNAWGEPFSDGKILSQRLWEDWGPEAGIPAGYTFHGLRKSMGGLLSDAGATLHESRDFLDHATYKEVVTYNKTRDQRRSAIGGARKVTEFVLPTTVVKLRG